MGTRFECVLHATGPSHTRGFLKSAAEEALGEVERLHAKWSPFERSSVVARVNREAAQRAVRVDRETLALVLECRRLWRETGGAFDPTLGALMAWWGFRGHPGESSPRDWGAPRPAWGMRHVEIDERESAVRFRVEGIALDLGSIAKGAALDAAGAVLREAGVESALVHGGTSGVVALGAPPGCDGWLVRISDGPCVVLRDEALSVSEAGGRVVESDGVALGHVLDPISGEAVIGAKRAAVVHERALDADAWSTQVLVSGGLAGATGVGRARWAHVVTDEGRIESQVG